MGLRLPSTGPDKTSAPHIALLGYALAAAPVAAFLTDHARKITAANAAAAKLTGYELDALAGIALRTLYASGDDWSATERIVATASDQRVATTAEITLRTSQGHLVDVSVVIMPVIDDAGQRTGTLEFMTPSDPAVNAITHVTPLSNDDSAMVRFARGAAHDFKNFLAIIAGNVQLASSEKHAQTRNAFLAEAERARKGAERLANQMIAFARDRLTALVALNVQTIFEQQAAILRAAAGPAITLTFDTAPDTAFVLTDRNGLENALLNLVINARDAMPDGGTITVSAQNLEISSTSKADQKFIAIRVRDTGTGMTERVRQRAFDPFFSTKSASRGTGLGLATVLGFARQSGGHAEIASELGAGTTVTVLLPALETA